jgi:hypothetical protein
MPMLERPGGAIRDEITDLTPPWIKTPLTTLFHHALRSFLAHRERSGG